MVPFNFVLFLGEWIKSDEINAGSVAVDFAFVEVALTFAQASRVRLAAIFSALAVDAVAVVAAFTSDIVINDRAVGD